MHATCPTCGERLLRDRCPRCGLDPDIVSHQRLVHRETLLLATLVVIAIALFSLTRLAAQRNHELRLRDAATWHRRAVDELDAGRPDGAIAAFRHAAATLPDHAVYQLDLARTLAGAGQDTQARQILLRLRVRRPEDADVNLSLARLEAQGADTAAAVRYYAHTLAALWSEADAEDRLRVRLELIAFLLSRDQPRRALAELLVLSPTLHDDHALRTQVGRLFLAAGDPRRALDQFATVLDDASDDDAALAGAGEAAFALGDYARARSYLSRASDLPPATAGIRTIADLVMTRDPLATRIGGAERRRRLRATLGELAVRLAACTDGRSTKPSAELAALGEELAAFTSSLDARRTRSVEQEVAESGLDLGLRAARAVAGACGERQPLDEALVLIARRHEAGVP
jgi:tetratricopeptide (TPR) repeat protein